METPVETRVVPAEELGTLLSTTTPLAPLSQTETPDPTPEPAPTPTSTSEPSIEPTPASGMPAAPDKAAPRMSVLDAIRARQAHIPKATDVIAARKSPGDNHMSAADLIRQRKTGVAVGAASDPRSVIFNRKYNHK